MAAKRAATSQVSFREYVIYCSWKLNTPTPAMEGFLFWYSSLPSPSLCLPPSPLHLSVSLPPCLSKDSISIIILDFETPVPSQFPLTPCGGMDSFWKCTSGQIGVQFKEYKRWWSWEDLQKPCQAYSGGQLNRSCNLSVILISCFYFRGPQRKQELTHLPFPLWGRKWR